MTTLRTSLLALLCVALLPLPSAVMAGVVFLPVVEQVLTDPGVSRVKHTPSGRYRITTAGLISTAVIDCTGNDQCQGTGLHGKIIDIESDLRIAIDYTGAGVTGKFRGTIFFPDSKILPYTARFRGDIEGRAQCLPAGEQACPGANFTLRAVAPLADQAGDIIVQLLGNVTWQLQAVFERNAAGNSGEWVFLDGEGGLTVIFEE